MNIKGVLNFLRWLYGWALGIFAIWALVEINADKEVSLLLQIGTTLLCAFIFTVGDYMVRGSKWIDW